MNRNHLYLVFCLPILALWLAGAPRLASGQDEFGFGPGVSLNELEPEQALEVLKRMLELSGTNKFADYNIASSLIHQLVNISEIHESKCDSGTFSLKPDAPIRLLQSFCRPYINHYVGQQLHECEPKFQSRIATFLAHFPEERKRDMRLLVDEVNRYRLFTPSRAKQLTAFRLNYPEEDLVRGVAAFVELKEGGQVKQIMKNPKQGRANFELAYIKWVVTMCINLNQGLKSSVGIYTTVFKFGLENLQLDEQTSEWMINYQVCDKILQSEQSLVGATYDALVTKYRGHKTSWRGWLRD